MDGSVVCAECFAQVGYDGAQRGVLLLPCQHMMHASCEEYCRKIRALRKLMSGRAERKDALQLRCPACQTIVQRVIPLFLNPLAAEGAHTADKPRESSLQQQQHQANRKRQRSRSCDTSQPQVDECDNEDDEDATGQNQRDCACPAYKAQNTYLTQVRRLWKERERSSDLWRACADYHQRKEEAQQCIEELGKLLPTSLALTSPSGATTRNAGNLASRHDFEVEFMSLTELEMYLAQTFPQLDRLVSENRTLRTASERKRKRLEEVQQRYNNEKKNQRANGTSTSSSNGRAALSERTGVVESTVLSSSRRENGCTPLFAALRHSSGAPSASDTGVSAVLVHEKPVVPQNTSDDTLLTEKQSIEPRPQTSGRTCVVIDVDGDDRDSNASVSEDESMTPVNSPRGEGGRVSKNDATISQVDERGWFSPMTDLRRGEFPSNPSGESIEIISDVEGGDRFDNAIDVDDDDDHDDPGNRSHQLHSSSGGALPRVERNDPFAAPTGEAGNGTDDEEEEEGSSSNVPSYFFPRSVSYPVMGRSVKRSLRDLPRREDALWQPSIDRFR